MTGKMSLHVSEILIKFRNLSRLFELFGCAILDSVSVVACTFLRLSQVFLSRAWPSTKAAKVTLRHSVLSVGCLNTPKFLWEFERHAGVTPQVKYLEEIFCQSKMALGDFSGRS